MKHLGDITRINGYVAPVVDVIIGGSPCQDLSLAGKRAGLAGARSGLYMEQIRIIKEMRENDRTNGRTGVDVRPRYMVWENVTGAFSTNQGHDFAAVLEEAIRVAEPEAPSVPVPEKGWPTAGCFMGDTWSVAWRVLDAQFWGTSDKPLPQRRRRIALVADFGGHSAPEILFVRKSVSGDIEPGKPKRKATAGDAGEGSGGAIPCTLKIRGGCDGGGKGPLIQEDKSATLSTLQDQTLFQPIGFAYKAGKAAGSCAAEIEKSPTLLSSRNDAAVVYGIGSYHSNAWKSDNPNSGVYVADSAKTLDSMNCGYPACNQGGMAVVQPVTYQRVTGPLMANSHPGSYTGQDAFSDMLVAGVDCRNATEYEEQTWSLQSSACHNMNSNNVVRVRHIVRRLTPLEGERLQGYPDLWTALPKIEDMSCHEYAFWTSVLLARAMREGKARENENGVIEIWQFVEGEDEDDEGEWVNTHKPYKHKTKEQLINWYNRMIEADSSRYKALGNSIALPPWKWVLKRLCACYERDATMASLFDGIGGFPYIWEQLNGKGSCLWASEIEEFPMAVTKVRFGGSEDGK